MSLVAAYIGPNGPEIAGDSYIGDKVTKYPPACKIGRGHGFLYGVTGQYRVFQAVKNMLGELPYILPDGSEAPILKPEAFASKLRSELSRHGMLAQHNGISVMSMAPESTILFVNWEGIWEIGNDFVPFKN